MHDIGKNLVTMMLEGAGFNVIDLGVDLGVEKVIEQVEQAQPDILGLSALLTTTMPEMKKVIEALEEKGLRNNVKVIIGGAPVDVAFAQKIGADGYGKDATEAVNAHCRELRIFESSKHDHGHASRIALNISTVVITPTSLFLRVTKTL
jgi:5-methyltetrahydrofolate--homocysteine methyltransferase